MVLPAAARRRRRASHPRHPDGKLTAAGIVKMQFGASQLTRDRETKALISLGDDLKAAATDALKKCATFLGVGLHLYADRPVRPEP